MKMCMQASYDRLSAYLCDMILEEQLKLGYEKETIRFYTPSASVGNILGMEERTSEHILQALADFSAYAADTLGEVQISKCSDERVCFLIPAKGATYVHENCDTNSFLRELITCFSKHHTTLEEVRALFEKHSEKAKCIHIGSNEFDEVFFFEDGVPDSYRYCVKFDAGHAFYHRFLKEDFEELLAEEGSMDTGEDNNKG